jgi:HD-GYP domain-containing protein (c-di-GMP phosphodiesterase class II)
VNDTRALLNRVADFRKRLEAMPRLGPSAGPKPSPRATEPVEPSPVAESRTQAILAESMRQLECKNDAPTPALTNRVRGSLADAHGLVTRLRAMADEPLLGGPPTAEAADPLAVLYRETASLTEGAVRYAMSFPDAVDEQARLCEGLEGMIDAARRRFDQLAGALERKRIDDSRIDRLARFLVSLNAGEGLVDPAPLLALAEELIAEEPGRPMRFLAADPAATVAHLGGSAFAAPTRFVAAHSLNCAGVLVRILRHDADWRQQVRDVVLAALLHDVGMLDVDPALLAHPGPLDQARRHAIEGHAVAGAMRIMKCLPSLSGLAEVVATHHERADGTGYPSKLTVERVAVLSRLVAAADVYAAMCASRPQRPALDPRAALTDVLQLAERGKLDRYSAEKLLTLGLYPVGTVVELADGSTAVVLTPQDPRTMTRAAARPVVGLLCAPDGRPHCTPRYLDLAEANCGPVVRTLEPMDRLRLLGRSFPEWV